MLRQTFTHIPGIGLSTETRLWERGVDDWSNADPGRVRLSPRRWRRFERYLDRSHEHLTQGNARFFADLLPASQHWRLFPDFRPRIAYLDIETTGLGAPADHITTIAVYDGQRVRHQLLRLYDVDPLGAGCARACWSEGRGCQVGAQRCCVNRVHRLPRDGVVGCSSGISSVDRGHRGDLL